MSCSKVLYTGTSTTPTTQNEFFLESGEEATIGIFGAGGTDEMQLQHNVAGNWVNTILNSVNQKLTSTNTLIPIRGKRFFRVIRTGAGTSPLTVELEI
jgi:hypothetical protein